MWITGEDEQDPRENWPNQLSELRNLGMESIANSHKNGTQNMLTNLFTEQELSAIGQLIDLISPSAEIANKHREQFLDADPDDVDAEDASALPWLLKDVVDWETGYFVDWKDTESFVQCTTGIAEAWGATVTFGTENPLDDDFLDDVTVPELMIRAHKELLGQGLILWNWNTQGDCYSGWLTRTSERALVKSLLEPLGVEVREADQPF
jgi:hypothetical protein